MTYKVNIKQDYNAEVAAKKLLSRPIYSVFGLSLAFFVYGAQFSIGPDSDAAQNSLQTIAQIPTLSAPEAESVDFIPLHENEVATYSLLEPEPVPAPTRQIIHPANNSDLHDTALETESTDENEVQQLALLHQAGPEATELNTPLLEEPVIPWQEVSVRRGDNMALIFKRQGLSPRLLHEIMHSGKEASALKRIMPGQKLRLQFNESELVALEYDINLTELLRVERQEDQYTAKRIQHELDKQISHARAEIHDSLYLAGQRANLSDKLIMEMVAIYGWDIDFALDIRKGDQFTVVYEEHYKDGKKVKDGPILAAEFVNQGQTFRAVRFTHEDGHTDYYSDTGHSMRKAFLRTPVNFARISSRFNLKRKHPVLNRIRAHKGVDYAASTGTPIKAAGDGTVAYKGRKGGYGKTLVLKHGGNYTTLYAHMSRYSKNLYPGKRVKQGQIIGYVGKTGLATGPHLHYEFRVNGVHRNPLTVKLPKALRIPDKIMGTFKQQTQPLLAQLDQVIDTATALAANETHKKQPMLVMNEESTPLNKTP